MAKIYKYRKITDTHTTYCLREQDYNLLGTEERITELCEIDGETYVSVPDGMDLPEQKEVAVEPVDLTEGLIADIKAASPHVRLINSRVVYSIRERYDINDEFKMLRIGPSDETAKYNDYVEECRKWGWGEKEKLGLII